MQSRHLQLVHLALGALGVALDVPAEPLLELVVAVKQCGHDEVQQTPELGHGVLNGRAGQQQPAPALELQQHLPALAGGRLDSLGLVQHEVHPGLAGEVLVVGDHDLVAGHHDMEGGALRVQVLLAPEAPQHLALLGAAPVGDTLEVRDKSGNLL